MSNYLGCSKSMSKIMPAVMMVLLIILIFFPLETPAVKSGGEDDKINRVKEVMSSSSSSGHEEEFMNWAGYGEEKLSIVTVTGRVVCRNPCYSKHLNGGIADQLPIIPVSGASVSISCGSKGSRKYKVRAITDENGDFFIELPSHLHAIPNLDKYSFVKLIHLPKDSLCYRPRNTRKQIIKGINLRSTENGVRSYVAHTMHFRPRSSKTCKFIGAI